jgi:hypothetical protein
MASVLVPAEAAGHLGAILLAYNRQILVRFLDEADELARLNLSRSAILIAGAALEFFESTPSAGVLSTQERRNITQWRQLRNQVAHTAVTPSLEQAQHMVDGIRRILADACAPGESIHHFRPLPDAVRTVKGKYAHLPTSSDDFIKRKRDDLELENRG